MNVVVENVGDREGDEVVMLYHVPRGSGSGSDDLKRPAQEVSLRLPHRRLLDFQRVSLNAHQRDILRFQVNASSLGLVDSEGNTYLYEGEHRLRIDNGPHASSLTMNVTVDLVNGPLLIDALL
eukprot:SAG31_NODE_715_length_12634_cov_5.289190_2_plen_123_part_00